MSTPRKWESLKSEEVYIYPSANSDDGGDVNSEHNLSEITYKMIYKNFVVCREGDIVVNGQGVVTKAPLLVSLQSPGSATPYIRISEGTAVIEGYLIRIYPSNGQYVTFKLDSSHVPNLNSFIAESKSKWYNLYDSNTGYPKILSPQDIENLGYSELPRLHVVLKLMKNITGNVRGDMYSRENGVVTRINKGLAISVMTDEDLAEMDIPYLVIGNLYYSYKVPGGSLSWSWYAEENVDKYQYISNTMIISPVVGMTFQEWVIQQIARKVRHVDTITRMELKSNGAYDCKTDLSVRDGNVVVTRYSRKSPNVLIDDTIDGDFTGDVVYDYQAINDPNSFDSTYSIDSIQARTHPASKKNFTTSTSEDNRIAHIIDSNDDGVGGCKVWFEASPPSGYKTSGSGVLNENGNSKLIARADHRHDARYLLNSSAWDNQLNSSTWYTSIQTIGTQVRFRDEIKGLQQGSDTLWIVDRTGFARFNKIKSDTSLEVEGQSDLKGNTTIGVSGEVSQLVVNSSSVFNGDVAFNESVIFNDQFVARAGCAVHKRLVVSENGSSPFVLDVVQNSDVTGSPYINANANTINLNGDTTLTPNNSSNPILVNGKFKVTGTTELNGKLTITTGGAAITGNTSVTGTLTSSGKLSVSSGGAAITGDTTIAGAVTIGSSSSNKNLRVYGDITGNRVYGSVWNDYAELYLRDPDYTEEILPGTIIGKVPGTNYYRPCGTDIKSRKLAVGVVSNSWGHLLGGDESLSLEENLKKYIPVALVGRVNVRVAKVKISEGDLLYVSEVTPGIANCIGVCGTVIGKALEDSDGSKDKVLMQVFLS